MKCPKCGYLGFETTDRCRNCQYDFSLAPFPSDEPDLTLRRNMDAAPDFELPPIKRQTDALSSTALDLDRLFGEPDAGAAPPAEATAMSQLAREVAAVPPPTVGEPPVSRVTIVDERDLLEPPQEPVAPALTMAEPADDADVATPAEDALPFDDAPLVPPPAARPPLAVRRSTPELPRNRHRTTRPVRPAGLNLEPAAEPKAAGLARAADDTIASLVQAPSLGARIGAGLIDVALMVAIFTAITYLTLRVTGLQNTVEDLRVLPPVPFVGFLAVLTFGYVGAFTVGGGQTIGKMVLGLRVIGDDGRPVDAAGGMLRALGCMLVPVTLGLTYLPALFTSEHRALHDRLAGTRVVQE